jgi:hypothetical protein
VQVFAACFTSGMAGVYFEKLIKGGTQSVWTRNFFLAVFSLGFGGVNVLLRESAWVRTRGFFSGVDSLVLLLVCVNAAGGMIVGMVMKYADNILKGFAVRESWPLATASRQEAFASACSVVIGRCWLGATLLQTGISTLLSTMCSVVLFNFEPNFGFALGAVIVVLSTFMCELSCAPPAPPPLLSSTLICRDTDCRAWICSIDSNAKVIVGPLPEAMQKTLLA